MSEVKIRQLAPFEVDPLILARYLLTTTPRWRWLRKRRLRREIARMENLET
jgi:hypothetical protein